MTCIELEALLDDLVDGTIAGDARARAEAHLQECQACRSIVADLRNIRGAARGLPRMSPPPDGWTRLAAALDAQAKVRTPNKVADLGEARREKTRGWQPRRPQSWGALAAAAVLVLATATGLLLYRNAGTPATAPGAGTTAGLVPAHPEGSDIVQTVESELQMAEQHYQKAIAGLEQIAREGQSSLDPDTAAVLAKNMGIVEQSIRESRDALNAQPASEVAQATLFEGLRRKVDLLKDTVALINEMRKGNQAGAAQIVGKS